MASFTDFAPVLVVLIALLFEYLEASSAPFSTSLAVLLTFLTVELDFFAVLTSVLPAASYSFVVDCVVAVVADFAVAVVADFVAEGVVALAFETDCAPALKPTNAIAKKKIFFIMLKFNVIIQMYKKTKA
ncbi:hypothetical protein ACSVH2_11865 [Flavobacterium sp. RSB2_4_14]|uniref:hypothetical protein n=1 Tax=Flavobacterium sp. RSB2_4_14 TaxID=3447665 RepID=UPI003F3A71AD